MAAHNYDRCIALVLKHEGGYADHPNDPGGPTNYGITLAVARENGYVGHMRNLPLSTAKAIYRKNYWDALNCDKLPIGVDYAVFDYGVNSGVSRALKIYNKAKIISDPEDIVAYICDERMRFLKGLRTWGTFGKGWSRRVTEVRAVAMKMARTDIPAPSLPPDVEPVEPKQSHWAVRLLKFIFKRRG